MIRTAVIFSFILLHVSGVAQDKKLDPDRLPENVFFEETFVDDRNQWSDFDFDAASGTVKDGKYLFKGKRYDRGHITFDSYAIDPTSEFYVETSFRIILGPDNHGSGLVLNHGSYEKNSGMRFEIAQNKYFQVLLWENGELNKLVSWTPCKYVHTDSENKLGVFVRHKTMEFYVNDFLVATIDRPKYQGTDIGFIVARSSIMSIDYFRIRYNSEPISEIDHPVNGYSKVPLKGGINSTVYESDAVVSPDGLAIFFTRGTNQGFIHVEKRKIMYAERVSKQADWSNPKELPEQINQGGRPKVVGVSADKRKLYFTGTYAEGIRLHDKGISLSEFKDGKWTAPQTLNIEGFTNLDYFETYSVSASNRIMILAIQDETSIGELDLYVSFYDGKLWSKPRNLGKKVNSYADEGSPCLAPDNVTLYFTSNGRPGYGKEDVFVTRRLDNTWSNWTTPKNLGPEINSKFEDSGLKVDADGFYAYLERDGGNELQTELCRIQIPEYARPEPVVIVHGRVLEMPDEKHLGTEIYYEDLFSNTIEGYAESSSEDGSFVLVLPTTTKYGISTEAIDYMVESPVIDFSKKETIGFSDTTVKVLLYPLGKGQTAKLNNMHFDPAKYEILPESEAELKRLYKILLDHPDMKIEIHGHTEVARKKGSEQYLINLSENRAGAIKNYLIELGITQDRMTTVGHGGKDPVSTDQNLNRRVEIKILNL
ncbi:MAG: hypothetical protein CL840_06290 [Crocinitomicaceae bacterium]|nr:hypothetical protein [Crocinitomicaceae bacterium]|tara:strand:+ start:3022 stop:5148 length:2127 start_codon:yes stop_codon:yes gene_type:complete